MKHTEESLRKFIKTFNAAHRFTKITKMERGVSKGASWDGAQFTVKVLSTIDRRKSVCQLFCNIWDDWSEEKMSDIINDKFRGVSEFFDSNPGAEMTATFAKRNTYGKTIPSSNN